MASAHRQSVLCSDTSPSQTSSHPRLRSPAEHQPSHYDDSSPLPLDRRCCSSSSSSLSSSPSLYATFKIFQLVSSFCRRVKTRVSNQRYQGPPKKEGARLLQDDFCQEFERQAFDEIDKYLGRKTYRPHRKTIASGTITDAADCIDESSVAKEVRRLLTSVNQAFCPGQPKLNSLAKSNKLFLRRGPSFRLKRLSLKQLQRLLVTVANLLQTIRCASPTRSPTNSREAGDPDIDTTYTANLEHLLLCLRDQVLRLLVAKLVQIVEEHISECQKDQGKHEDNWFFEFPDARHPLSTTWPWSIRPSLAVLWGVCWMFYDFTNESDHICFVHEGQYYCLDEQGNMINAQGGLVVPAHQVQLFRQGMQQRQLREQQDAILSLGSNNNSNNNRISGYTGGQQRQQARARQPMMPASSAQRGTPGVPSTGGQGGRALAPGTAPQLAGTGEGFSRHGRPVAASPQSGRGGAQDLKLEMMQSASTRTNNNSNGGNNNNNTSSTSSAYHPAGASASAAPSQAAYSGSIVSATQPRPHPLPHDWVPQDHNSGFDHTANQPGSAWGVATYSTPHQYQHQHQHQHHDTYPHLQPALPPHTHTHAARPNHLTPTPAIRVSPLPGGLNTDFDASQPQDSISPSPASSGPYTPHQANNNAYWPGHQHHDSLSPIYARGLNMPGAIVDEQQMAPQNHAPPSPQSPHGNHSPHFEIPPPGSLTSEMTPNLKRTFGEYTDGQGDVQNDTRSRANSHTSGNNSATSPAQDEFSSRQVPRTIKRSDPPVNHDNKYICDFADECRGITFDRKCEWSKHMDKHDRPYRCPHPQCAKLQGFTYSGGLLRHEREVHDKHGGPKAKLICPHVDCKRHTGKGFTRKENLNEHIRRVHSGKELLPGDSMAIPPKADTNEHPFGATDDFDTSIAPELQEFDPTLNDSNNKRRRLNSITDGEHQVHVPESDDDLKAQLFRLREDNVLKDTEIRRLQENEVAQAERLKTLEETVRLMQQAQQAQNGMSQLPEHSPQMQDDLSHQHQPAPQ